MASEALAPQRMSARLAGSFILCALVMIIDGYDLTAMSLAVPHLVREWGVPPSHFGIALSAAVVWSVRPSLPFSPCRAPCA